MWRVFLFLSVLTLASAQCADNSLSLELNDTVCYSFHSKMKKFSEAQNHCKSFGAQLVSLKSEYINVFVTGFAGKIFDDKVFIWTGGNNLQNSQEFVWPDGEKLEYTHFPKENNTKNGSCISAEIKQGFWKADNCFAEFSFVCEFLAGKGIIPVGADSLDLPPHNATPNPAPEETTTEVAPTTVPRPKCPDTWFYFPVTKFCYSIFDESVDWQSAENKCVENGAHLVSIHSQEEDVYVKGIPHQASGAEKGWYSQTWIGFYSKNKDATWEWTDGTPSDYLQWGPGEPSTNGIENCGQMYSRKFYGPNVSNSTTLGDFNDFECDKVIQDFICKKAPQ